MRTDQEKAAALEGVDYEMNMLTACAFRPAPEDTHTRNALLESFIIHGRSILQFLIPEGSESNYVLAQHFFDKRSDWERARGAISGADKAVLKEFRTRANNLVAHVTWDRVAILAAERGTNIEEVFRILQELYARFRASKP